MAIERESSRCSPALGRVGVGRDFQPVDAAGGYVDRVLSRRSDARASEHGETRSGEGDPTDGKRWRKALLSTNYERSRVKQNQEVQQGESIYKTNAGGYRNTYSSNTWYLVVIKTHDGPKKQVPPLLRYVYTTCLSKYHY